jgi:hypothetical protein
MGCRRYKLVVPFALTRRQHGVEGWGTQSLGVRELFIDPLSRETKRDWRVNGPTALKASQATALDPCWWRLLRGFWAYV